MATRNAGGPGGGWTPTRSNERKINKRWWHVIPTKDVAKGDRIVWYKTPPGWSEALVERVSRRTRDKRRWSLLTKKGEMVPPQRVYLRDVKEVWRRGKATKKKRNPLLLKPGAEGWDRYGSLVADAYAKAPDYDPAALPAWEALERWIPKMFKRIQGVVDVEFVDDDPYRDDEHLRDEVARTGVLKVWTGGTGHAVWSNENNLKFRAIHDWMAHIQPKGKPDFGMKGEIAGYNAHLHTIPPLARRALFTEVVGQAAVALNTGEFPEQKIAFLEGFDPYRVGNVTGWKIVGKTLRQNPRPKQKDFSRGQRVKWQEVPWGKKKAGTVYGRVQSDKPGWSGKTWSRAVVLDVGGYAVVVDEDDLQAAPEMGAAPAGKIKWQQEWKGEPGQGYHVVVGDVPDSSIRYQVVQENGGYRVRMTDRKPWGAFDTLPSLYATLAAGKKAALDYEKGGERHLRQLLTGKEHHLWKNPQELP